jgi:hypothetical protein
MLLKIGAAGEIRTRTVYVLNVVTLLLAYGGICLGGDLHSQTPGSKPGACASSATEALVPVAGLAPALCQPSEGCASALRHTG